MKTVSNRTLDVRSGSSPAADRNLSIEGLRGLLASSVIAYHVYEMGSKQGFYPATTNPVVHRLGPYAVCIFFCVSGFLILQTLLSQADIGKFFINRAARIYPVFAVLHLLIFAVGPLANYDWMASLRHNPTAWGTGFVSNLLFLPGLFPLPIAQKNAWSLSYEAFFYCSAAAIYWSFQRRRRLFGWPMLAGSVALAGVVVFIHTMAAFFLIGIFSFWLVRKGYAGAASRIGTPPALIALMVGLWVFPYARWISTIATFFFFFAVVNGTGLLGRVLSSRVMTWLGRISYSLYLVHPFVLDPMRMAFGRLAMKGHVFLVGLCFATIGPVAAIGASYLSYLAIEKKLTRAIFRKGRNPATRHSPVTLDKETVCQ